MIFKVIILFCFVQNLHSENIGCTDPENTYYDSNAEFGYFIGLVEGGSQCNQNGWSQNYIGINLEYYNSNQSLFEVGNEINFGDYTYYIDAMNVPTNCNQGVALVYIVNDSNNADGNPFTFEEESQWQFFPSGISWQINACQCNGPIDCNNVCQGNNFDCLECNDGDFTNDNEVNVLDVISLVSCVIESNCTNCYDINNDGNQDVLDVVILVDNILNWQIGCLDPLACNYNSDNNESCTDCCTYESIFYDCEQNCLIDEDADGECDDIKYQEYFVGLDLSEDEKNLFALNAIRFEEICLDNLREMRNPLRTIFDTGTWPIYYHVENWNGDVNDVAISNLTSQYEQIAHDWLEGLQDYDPEAPNAVDVKVFGYVFNEGVALNNSFLETYNSYPIVTNYTLTNEESPWEIRFRNSDQIFNQNWYTISNYLDLYVYDNRIDLSPSTTFQPNSLNNFTHPQDIDMFVTKFWHKTTWDAVAQRQYLKIGGQIYDYENGFADYRVFAHEMGHCFFLDDIYDPGKYPDGQNLISIMNTSGQISDFDRFLLRIVWKAQKSL